MTQQESLFALLRLGLGLPDFSDFPILQEKEWLALRKVAQQQGVEALCCEGISRLPLLKRPPLALRLQWGGAIIRTERQICRLNKVLEEISTWLKEENIRFILLKGSTAANRYPNPLRRQCGDIDLLVIGNGFYQACLILKHRGAIMVDEAPEKHTSFLWQDITIELHHTLMDFNSPQALDYIRRMDFHKVSTYVLIDGKSYPALRTTFDSAYMIAHLLHHIWTDGIRLRQICDWMMLMQRHDQEIDHKELTEYLRQMRLSKMFPILLCIGIKYFGLPSEKWEKYVTASDKLSADKLLQYILPAEGHFHSRKKCRNYSAFQKHCRNALSYISHLYQFHTLSPVEAFWFLPARIWRFFYKKLPFNKNKTVTSVHI